MRRDLDELIRCATAEWRMKLWLGSTLFVVMCTGYYVVGHIPFHAVATLVPTPIDRAVPFSVAWTGIYISLYLLLPFAWLIPSRERLWR